MDLKERIKLFINEHANEEKARYDEGLVTTKHEIKGVKTEELHEFAKTLASEGVNVKDMPTDFHEEIILVGLVIAYSKIKPSEKVKLLKYYMPLIDNWGTCDLVVPKLKGMESERKFFVDLLSNSKPFYVRVAIVWFKKFELKKNLRKVVNLLNEKIDNTNYYVEMGLAWVYCEALILDYEYMVEWIQTIDRYVIRNRTLQKACDSYRVSDERKKEIRALRSKLLGMPI